MSGQYVIRFTLGVCFSTMFAIASAQTIGAEEAATEPETQENAEAEATPEEPNPDEIADLLNSRQQLQQTFTLERTINGEVVDSAKRTVTFSPGDPYQATEANPEDIREALKSRFDGELLTRNEAFEEAKIDFIIADVNRDGAMHADEFAVLAASWADNDTRNAEAPTEEIARQRHYDDFLAEISSEDIQLKRDKLAKQKFAFMAGAAEAISREDYIREYLLDFDTMDENNDGILKQDELRRFRAVTRGETIQE